MNLSLGAWVLHQFPEILTTCGQNFRKFMHYHEMFGTRVRGRAFGVHWKLLAQCVMPTRFPSKAFSCSDLIAGAAIVADQMQGVPTDLAVINYKRSLLSETEGMDIDELQKLLQDCFVGVCI